MTDALLNDFEVSLPEDASGESDAILLEVLAERISWLIEHNMEYLLSLLYRNDVAENRIHEALSPHHPEPANIALAKLVLERQKQRMATKKKFGTQSSDAVEEDLRW